MIYGRDYLQRGIWTYGGGPGWKRMWVRGGEKGVWWEGRISKRRVRAQKKIAGEKGDGGKGDGEAMLRRSDEKERRS